jgi:4-amino-4-deoxy-L-arabinose transferase-like glycosyltransferase
MPEPSDAERPEPTPSPEPATRRRLPRVDGVALAILAVAAVLLVRNAWVVGPTYDEHFYVVSGMSYWADGDFSLNREHPPLLKLLAGLLPTLIGPVDLPPDHARLFNLPAAFFYQEAGDHWRTLLFLGRLPFCLLTLATGVVVFAAARRWFGSTPARVVLAVCVLNPNVLAHGSLAALDMGCAAAMTIAVVAFVAALRSPAPKRRLAAGVALGLACATKFTALVLWPVVFGAALARALATRSLAPVGTIAWCVPVALTAFAACYGFEARSIESVRRHLMYLADAPRVDPPAGELADELVRRAGPQATVGLEPFVAGLRELPSSEAVAERWLAMLAPAAADARLSDEVVAARTAALHALAPLGGRVRKSAFRTVLDLPRPAAQERAELLAALSRAEVRPEGDDVLAPWRSFLERNLRTDWDLVVLAHPLLSGIVRGLCGEHRPVPLLSALAGLDHQFAHADVGHTSYYRGRTYRAEDFAAGASAPLYYPDVLFHKHPLGFVVLFVLGAGLACVRSQRWGRLDALVVVGAALLLLVVLAGGNGFMGVRYALPLLPLLALLAGRAALAWPRAAAVLAGLGLVESLWIHPHHLMYFNLAAGGPRGGSQITISGDDWGQDAAALGAWLAENEEAVRAAGGLYYDPYLEADPIALGLGASQPLVRGARGYAAVSLAELRRDPERYAWLADQPVVDTVGYTITIYDTRAVELPRQNKPR